MNFPKTGNFGILGKSAGPLGAATGVSGPMRCGPVVDGGSWVCAGHRARVWKAMINIYVGNLPYSTTDSDLEKLFSQHGQVVRAQVLIDRETGRSRGFGFVEMANPEEGKAAIAALNGQDMGGRPLRINEAQPREAGAGRGGFGGNRGGGFGGGGGGGGGYRGKSIGDRGDRGSRDGGW
jgi:RNA recognition motif. (a.k.a. RRM, RBD, or RNP domain)